MVHAEPDSQRCFENEQARVKVWVSQDTGAAAVKLNVEAVDVMQLEVLDAEAGQVKPLRSWHNGGVDTRSGPASK